MPNVSIKLLREGAKLPVRGSASAAGYDLYACLDGDQALTIPPHATAMLPPGPSFALPAGPFGAVVTARGRRSRRTLAQALREACPDISVVCIGDAQHPATAMEAVAQAAQMAAAHVPQGAKAQPENA